MVEMSKRDNQDQIQNKYFNKIFKMNRPSEKNVYSLKIILVRTWVGTWDRLNWAIPNSTHLYPGLLPLNWIWVGRLAQKYRSIIHDRNHYGPTISSCPPKPSPIVTG